MEKSKTTEKGKLTERQLQQKHDLQVKLNRLYAKRAALEKRLKSRTTSDRLRRTRTLIQLGGLVAKSGLMELCDIYEGDDLQTDIPNLDKAATLLGILSETMNHLTENADPDISALTPQQQDQFRKLGKRLLKRI